MTEPSTAYQKVLPQLLGISFALVLFGTFFGKTPLLYGALAILFGLIIRARLVVLLGEVLHEVIGWLGQKLVVVLLGLIYFTFITPYAFLYRAIEQAVVKKFRATDASESFFIKPDVTYSKEYFERPW